jgi:2-polyprenyl-3-methyl-5-hydroxy-6-metoxy-1,4-benzoquinol methylase
MPTRDTVKGEIAVPDVMQASMPSPELLFDVARRYADTETLTAAIELDVFTAIGEGNVTPAALAQRCQASERGMRILCDALVIIGFLTKNENRYALTPDSALFLDRRSRAYLGTIQRFIASAVSRDAFSSLTEAVRKGGTALGGQGSMEPENPIWVEFARSMAPMMQLPAEQIAALLDSKAGSRSRVLDIAAGHGVFGITIARHNPNAEVTALDWPGVLEVARENARQAGIAARYRLLAGSAFDVDFGTGFDIVLLTNFLHHFDQTTCQTLLRKVHAALVPGGRTVILDFVPNEDRVSPPATAKFSLTMLAMTCAGDAYTFSEYERMLGSAGFRSITLHGLPPTPQQVVLAVK